MYRKQLIPIFLGKSFLNKDLRKKEYFCRNANDWKFDHATDIAKPSKWDEPELAFHSCTRPQN